MDPQYPQQNYTNSQQQGYMPPPPGSGYTPPQPSPYGMTPYSQSLTEPLTMGQYLLMYIILAIPLVNLVMLFIWAFGSSTNLNKKNFARASLIIMAAGIVLSIVFSSIFAAIFSAF